ncbi:MAG: GH3 auxin-responsive promoter family protein [Phormidesmis sp.]
MSSLLSCQAYPLTKRFDAAARHPAQALQRLLQALLARHQNTAFGKAHGFRQISTPQDYRRAVPIHDYEALRPYVQQMMQGKAGVLVSDPVEMFTLTSGTTGQSKYIPVTAFSAAQNARLVRQWLYRLLRDHPRCLSGSIVGVVSPAIEGYTDSGIPYGSLSGRIYQEMPWLLRRTYAVPYPVFEIKDYEARYWAISRFAMARDVSFLCTPNPSTLLRLAGVMADHTESLLRSIHNGDLGHIRHALSSAQQDKLRSYLRPQPRRAHWLEAQLQQLSDIRHLRPQDCWPQIQSIGCWTGGSVGVQAQKLAPAYGPVPIRDIGYLASEARVTLPMADGLSSGVLDLTLNYCEFIPEEATPEDITEENDLPIYLSHELEKGRRYSILLTTPGGLYRYHINDIVEVTGFYHRAPLLAFVRKGKDMSSLTGEKLHVDQIQAGMLQVQRQFKLAVDAYQWVADIENMSYRVYLEWSDRRGDDWIQQTLLPELDQALRTLNGEYAQKRASRRLLPLRCYRMRPGWAEAIKRGVISAGGRDVQYKWPLLCSQISQNPITVAYQQAMLPQAEAADSFSC